MEIVKTALALANITDEGLFELLATDVLRIAHPRCKGLSHPGVNAEGKTVKSPLDCISYFREEDSLHLLAVHHTITAKDGLEKKWLHDPAKVKPRKLKNGHTAKGTKSQPGDLIKTASYITAQRQDTPDLLATLILTTNEEPAPETISAVQKAAENYNITVDVWTRSRICSVLDNEPAGQWLRYQYLKIDQELLSKKLLRKISKHSLKIHQDSLLVNPAGWIDRSLDSQIAGIQRAGVTFIVSSQGLGKSVACHRRLLANENLGGISLTLAHETVAASLTLEQAIMTTLRSLHPRLAKLDHNLFSFFSADEPLLLLLEDINRSGNVAQLTEKLISWSYSATNSGTCLWILLCPLWPEVLHCLSDHAQKQIAPIILAGAGFSETEGRTAVLTRARLEGRDLSILTAHEISTALGNDPLLIALHEFGQLPDPHETIEHFILVSLQRIAANVPESPASDFLEALRALATQMLRRRRLEPRWSELCNWGQLSTRDTALIGRIAKAGTLIGLLGPTDDQRIQFRHDRVRDSILADAVADLEKRALLEVAIVADPFFAEVVGTGLIKNRVPIRFLDCIRQHNPLAIFQAFRLAEAVDEKSKKILRTAIYDWLEDRTISCKSNNHKRWNALLILSKCNSPSVVGIVNKFPDRTVNSDIALLRNGDPTGGIELCLKFSPAVPATWRDDAIAHAKSRHRQTLAQGLSEILRKRDLDPRIRTGALLLAGYLAESHLVHAIQECWLLDEGRVARLDDYLWACSHCCWEEPERYLSPIFDIWSTLSDKAQSAGSSPRMEVLSSGLAQAFGNKPPLATIDFICRDRPRQDPLWWPMVYLSIHVDHPRALAFIINEIQRERRSAKPNSLLQISFYARHNWETSQRYSQPMSDASRDFLFEQWNSDERDTDTRRAAFSLWNATHKLGDLERLRAAKNTSGKLSDDILRARLNRGDQTAISMLIGKLAEDTSDSWWWNCRRVWSPELTKALDDLFLRDAISIANSNSNLVAIVCELIQRLPASDGSSLLQKHWISIKRNTMFLLTALYVATPEMILAAQLAIAELPDPRKVFEHFGFNYHLFSSEHPGLTSQSQLHALAPYLHLMKETDWDRLRAACNQRGWFDIRAELLDPLYSPGSSKYLWNHGRAKLDLDEISSKKRWGLLDDWTEYFLGSNVTWDEIRDLLFSWLGERRSLEALETVTEAIVRHGSRGDFELLVQIPELPPDVAQEIIADAYYAVCRRRLD